MSTHHVEIPIEEFGQKQFTDWVKAERREIRTQYLKDSETKPYSRIVKKYFFHFKEFAEEKVMHKIERSLVHFISFEIQGKKWSQFTDFFDSLARSLQEAIVCEYGESGFVPPPLTSVIISDIESGVKALQRQTAHSTRRQRHGGALSPRTLRIACQLCRQFENLTNLLWEMTKYISRKDRDENSDTKSKINTTWHKKIQEIIQEIKDLESSKTSQETNEALRDLLELAVGSGELGTQGEGLSSVLDEVRKIRNLIAHPSDVSLREIDRLIDLSENTVKMLRGGCPMLARVSSVRTNVTGVTQVGLYLELDRKRANSRTVIYEDLLNLGQSIDASCVGKEVIVYPVTQHKGKKYEISKEIPILIFRDPEFVKLVYESKNKQGEDIKPKVIIEYSEITEEVIEEQPVTD